MYPPCGFTRGASPLEPQRQQPKGETIHPGLHRFHSGVGRLPIAGDSVRLPSPFDREAVAGRLATLPDSLGISFLRFRVGRYVPETSSSRTSCKKVPTPLSSMASSVTPSIPGAKLLRLAIA